MGESLGARNSMARTLWQPSLHKPSATRLLKSFLARCELAPIVVQCSFLFHATVSLSQSTRCFFVFSTIELLDAAPRSRRSNQTTLVWALIPFKPSTFRY